MDFNPDKHFLGSLCKRGHSWQDTGQSLRLIKNRTCLECARMADRKRYAEPEKREKQNQQRRQRYHSDLEYRAKQIENARKAYYKDPDRGQKLKEWAEKRRTLYNSDPGYRLRRIEQNEKYTKSRKGQQRVRTRRKLKARLNSGNFYLGKLCSRNHEFLSTGKTLRYKSSQNCPECCRITHRQRRNGRTRIIVGKNEPFPSGISIPDEHYLGLLCIHGHNYRDTGYSLRKLGCRGCVECKKLESASEVSRKRAKEWREKNRDRMKEYLSDYYQRNRSYLIQKSRERERTPEGRLAKKVQTQKRRARQKQAMRIPYSSKQLYQRFEEFGGCCVYCGSPENLTPDHVIPIARGGIDALSNLVPACLSCNCSKQHRDYVEWFTNSAHFSIERLRMIAEAIGDENTLNNFGEKNNEH